MLDLANIKIEDFEPYINQTFQIILPEKTLITVQLIKIAKSSFFAPEQGRPFSLIFRANKDILLPQNTYLFTHEHTGEFLTFTVPIGLDKEGMCYEVIFT